MKKRAVTSGLIGVLFIAGAAHAQQLEMIAPSRGAPISAAVKAGKLVFVSGTPGSKDGKLAVGDFPTQMKQAMDNVAGVLKAAGTGWDRVVKTNVYLVRRDDFGEMNRLYATYFPDGKYPARTTAIVAGLPNADFLLEIECQAVVE